MSFSFPTQATVCPTQVHKPPRDWVQVAVVLPAVDHVPPPHLPSRPAPPCMLPWPPYPTWSPPYSRRTTRQPLQSSESSNCKPLLTNCNTASSSTNTTNCSASPMPNTMRWVLLTVVVVVWMSLSTVGTAKQCWVVTACVVVMVSRAQRHSGRADRAEAGAREAARSVTGADGVLAGPVC